MKMIEMKKFFNERGFMLMSVIFLLMMTSIAALVVMNGAKKVINQNSALRIIALHLAEEQFAEIERKVANDNDNALQNFSFLGDQNDLKNYYDSNNEKNPEVKPIIFDVTTSVGHDSRVEVKVKWTLDGEEYSIAIEKLIYITN